MKYENYKKWKKKENINNNKSTLIQIHHYLQIYHGHHQHHQKIQILNHQNQQNHYRMLQIIININHQSVHEQIHHLQHHQHHQMVHHHHHHQHHQYHQQDLDQKRKNLNVQNQKMRILNISGIIIINIKKIIKNQNQIIIII